MSAIPRVVNIPPYWKVPRRALEFDDESLSSSDDDDSSLESVTEAPSRKEKKASPKPTKVCGGPKPSWPSVVTPTDKATGGKVTPTPRHTFPLENAPEGFDDEIVQAITNTGEIFPQRGIISEADARVFKLPHLEMCPRKMNKKTCHCVEMGFGATRAFQDDIRALYCRVVQESNHEMGNKLLKSFMVSREDAPNRWKIAFKIPGIIFERRARVFYVCQPQFCKLFGISSKRFYKLIRERKEELEKSRHGVNSYLVFGWNRQEDCYLFNGRRFAAFRSDYWIDYMLKHGGYSEKDNFN